MEAVLGGPQNWEQNQLGTRSLTGIMTTPAHHHDLGAPSCGEPRHPHTVSEPFV